MIKSEKDRRERLKERSLSDSNERFGYAGSLRALRNTAKMKQAAEHRGKASMHRAVISQQSYSKKRHKKTFINY